MCLAWMIMNNGSKYTRSIVVSGENPKKAPVINHNMMLPTHVLNGQIAANPIQIADTVAKPKTYKLAAAVALPKKVPTSRHAANITMIATAFLTFNKSKGENRKSGE